MSRAAHGAPPHPGDAEQADAYAEPDLYDLLHAPDTLPELRALERIAARFVSPHPRTLKWLEPCCGTGRFLRLLARRGVRCAGVELDPSVAAYANSRLTGTKSRTAIALVGDIRTLDGLTFPRSLHPPFGFAFCPHNSVRHLRTPRDLTRHLAAVSAVLAPNGIYAVGIGLQPPGEPIVGEDVHTARRGSTRVTAVSQYFEAPRTSASARRMERIVTHTTVAIGRKSRLIESVYDLLCIDPAMWQRCIKAAGMVEVAVVDDERARDLPAERTDYAYRILARA